jgi:glutaredoxin-like YruB-family protein
MISQKSIYGHTRPHYSFSVRPTHKKNFVVVYSTSICPWCRTTKDFLKEYNIKFREIDVSRNMTALKKMIQKSGQMSVPVIDIGGEVIIGFDEDLLKEKLNL